MLGYVCRAVAVAGLVAPYLGPGARGGNNAALVAQRLVEMADSKNCEILYRSAGENPLSLVAVAPDHVATRLCLLDKQRKVLWSETRPDEFVQTVFPWLGNPGDPPTFVIITHGGAGVGYVVTIVGETGGKGRLLAREIGWGLAPIPEMALLGDDSRPSIIVAAHEDYKRLHRHAVVLSWDAKHQRVVKRRVAWAQRFQH